MTAAADVGQATSLRGSAAMPYERPQKQHCRCRPQLGYPFIGQQHYLRRSQARKSLPEVAMLAKSIYQYLSIKRCY
ncbi:hypothetical protein PG990_008272 [Apiospora arundinis]